MKGMMGFLEKAGLVQRDGNDDAQASASSHDAPADPGSDIPGFVPDPDPAPQGPVVALEAASGMGLEAIYAGAGVPPCVYPAERLIRLLDGLSAMDDGLRRQTILAIDAADDTWTLDDPLRDAAAKAAAIDAHARTLRAGVTQAERETRAQLEALNQRQATAVAEIKRQIGELEALLEREIARGVQDNAALNANLQARQDGAARELDGLQQTAHRLRALPAQFNVNVNPSEGQ
jgi:hypothetical protein